MNVCIMSRILSYTFLRRFCQYIYLPKIYKNIKVGVRTTYFIKSAIKLFVGIRIGCSVMMSESKERINAEDELLKALQEGGASIIKLMDQLKDFITIVSQEYRTCLLKQMVITKTAQDIGPFSEAWDELPQYRTLANELNNELIEYLTLFNTIGHMSREQLVNFVEDSNDSIDMVGVKFKELEVILEREFALNKKLEKELLEIKCDNILLDMAQ